MMRIVHLVSYPLWSGPVPSTVQLASMQQQLGHEVWLGYDTKRGNFAGFEEAAQPHITLPTVPMTLSTKSSAIEIIKDAYVLRRLLQQSHIDVVHNHMSHDHMLVACSIPASVQKKIAWVRTMHATRVLTPSRLQRMLYRHTRGFIVRCAAHAVLLAQHAINPIAIIPGAIDTTYWQATDLSNKTMLREQLGLPPHAILLGHVALLAGRGQEELLQACAITSVPVHIVLIGRGEQEQALRQLAKVLGIAQRVHFLGYLPAAILRNVYSILDGAFLAQAGNDASCRAALEAMGMALPLLAVAHDALEVLVTPTTGYPIATRDPIAIAKAITAWAMQPDESAKRGLSAKQWVTQKHTIRQEAAETLQCYEQWH